MQSNIGKSLFPRRFKPFRSATRIRRFLRLLHFNFFVLFELRLHVNQKVCIITSLFINTQKHIRAVESPEKTIPLISPAMEWFPASFPDFKRSGLLKRGFFSTEYYLYIFITYSLQKFFSFLSITLLNFQCKEFFVNKSDFSAMNQRRLYDYRRIKIVYLW